MKHLKSILIVSLALSTLVLADTRSYVWTYQYGTMPAGEAEFEHYLTFSAGEDGMVSAEHNFEIEIGMNDRFDVGIYQVFKQKPDAALTYDGFKIRTRYRFGERGRTFVDPMLYFEYKGNQQFDEHELEGKLILARDFGKLNLAVNPVAEIKFEDSKSEMELAFSSGLSYSISRLVRFGLEVTGSESGLYAGPVISHGAEGLYVALGSGFALGDGESDRPGFKVRMILGIDL